MDLFLQQTDAQAHQLVVSNIANMLWVHWVVSYRSLAKCSRCQVRSLQHFLSPDSTWRSACHTLSTTTPSEPNPSVLYPAHNTLNLDIKTGWETVLKGLLSWGKNIHCSLFIHKFSHFIIQGNPGGQVWLTPVNPYIYRNHSQPLLFYVPTNMVLEDSLWLSTHRGKDDSLKFPTLFPGLAWRGEATLAFL